jgi:hypothetical protein
VVKPFQPVEVDRSLINPHELCELLQTRGTEAEERRLIEISEPIIALHNGFRRFDQLAVTPSSA